MYPPSPNYWLSPLTCRPAVAVRMDVHQIGVPGHWDVRSLGHQASSVEATGDVKPGANRRAWGSGGGTTRNGAGSWIRSVFSASPSSSPGVGGAKRRGSGGRGAGGGGAGDEPSATASEPSDSTASTAGPLGGKATSTTSPLPKMKVETEEVVILSHDATPSCADYHRQEISTAAAGQGCAGKGGELGQGKAPILHACGAADRLAPQVLYTPFVHSFPILLQ